MHFDFIAEGWRPDLDEMEHWLHTRVFPMPMKHSDGSVTTEKAPAALRPRRAYTYVFPKDCLDIVLNTLKPDNCVNALQGHKEILGRTADILRMGLRLKKIPKPDITKGEFAMVRNNIRLVGLGIREDIEITEKGITHEAL